MSQSYIMIVDDNPANLKLLEDMLVQEGHEVRSFPLGRYALAAALNNPPDLILLDINMPEMNGYEVCQRLKSTPELAHIPVIFLSALNDIEDKVKAFEFGAVDYVSKPFQFKEIHARVETHLKLHDLQRQLQQQNERLEEAVAARTRELAQANQRLTILDASKNDFLNLISHEFRTPLHGLLGVGEIILDGMPSTEENRELQDLFEHSRQRILALLDDAMLLTEIDVKGEQFRAVPISLHAVLSHALAQTKEFSDSRNVTLAAPPADLGMVVGDEGLLVRAFHGLLETAVRFSDRNETIRLSVETAHDSIGVIIESHGKTIPEPALAKFFDLFAIAESGTPGRDLGLGPAVAHRILSLFGASVTVQNRHPSGIRLAISLHPYR